MLLCHMKFPYESIALMENGYLLTYNIAIVNKCIINKMTVHFNMLLTMALKS